jgi:glycosyltransferase involved in cell wall biosynthesis
MSNPKVSVIIPLFNYSQFIKDCIRSVLKQEYTPLEVIVIDDCSKDDSFQKASGFKKKGVKVIKLQANSGYSVAKNVGIRASTGTLITTLDADDMFTPGSIAKRVDFLQKNPKLKFVHARAIDVFGNATLDKCLKKHRLRLRRGPGPVDKRKPFIHAQSVMMHRSVYEDFGLYDEEMRSKSDKEMWRRLRGKHVELPMQCLNFYVAFYRKHGKSMMAKRRRNKRYQKRVIRAYRKAITTRNKQGITPQNTSFLPRMTGDTE